MIRFCMLGALLMLPGCMVVDAVFGRPNLREVGLRGLGWLDRVPNAFNDGFIRQRSLRVTFTAGRNLTRFARDYGYAIGADVRFCDGDEVDHCNRLGALGPADAETGRYPGMLQPKPEDLAGEGCLYHLRVASIISSSTSAPTQ